jgi:hypothetical protein
MTAILIGFRPLWYLYELAGVEMGSCTPILEHGKFFLAHSRFHLNLSSVQFRTQRDKVSKNAGHFWVGTSSGSSEIIRNSK